MASPSRAVLLPIPTLKPAHSEATRFFPRPGRSAPPRLQVAPPPEECTVYADGPSGLTWEDILALRGERPAPPAPKASRGKRKARAARTEPWNAPGFTFPEPLTGEQKHARDVRSAAEGLASIRPCPPSLSKLLALPEWAGATLSTPEPHDFERMRALCKAGVREAEAAYGKATGKANKARAAALIDARKRRLGRVPETIRVTHPSGAFILWLPTESD